MKPTPIEIVAKRAAKDSESTIAIKGTPLEDLVLNNEDLLMADSAAVPRTGAIRFAADGEGRPLRVTVPAVPFEKGFTIGPDGQIEMTVHTEKFAKLLMYPYHMLLCLVDLQKDRIYGRQNIPKGSYMDVFEWLKKKVKNPVQTEKVAQEAKEFTKGTVKMDMSTKIQGTVQGKNVPVRKLGRQTRPFVANITVTLSSCTAVNGDYVIHWRLDAIDLLTEVKLEVDWAKVNERPLIDLDRTKSFGADEEMITIKRDLE